MLPQTRKCEHIVHNFGEIHVLPVLPETSLPYVAGLEHLLNRAKQSVSIFEHDAVEITPLGLVQSTAFERFQVQANRRDRRLQFVGNCIQEAVLLFISADLADKENRIHDQASDQQSKQNDAEDQRNNLAPVEDHPADVESRCQRDEAGT